MRSITRSVENNVLKKKNLLIIKMGSCCSCCLVDLYELLQLTHDPKGSNVDQIVENCGVDSGERCDLKQI